MCTYSVVEKMCDLYYGSFYLMEDVKNTAWSKSIFGVCIYSTHYFYMPCNINTYIYDPYPSID